MDGIHGFLEAPADVFVRLSEETEVSVLSYTEEELDRILETDPGYQRLTLPAGTDIRLNDKIVSSETGLEYTAGQPRNIRGHHMTVKIYRTAQQRPL